MRIPITCGSCGRDFSAPDSYVGRKVVCPECGTGVKVKNSGIAPSKDSNDEMRSSSRKGRGNGANPKVILGVLGAVAAVIAGGVALNNLPSLAQLNTTVVTPPPSVAPQNTVTATTPPEASPPPAAVPQPTDKAQEAERIRQEKMEQTAVRQASVNTRKPRLGKRDRAQAAEEVDTERGLQLFSQIQEVNLERASEGNAGQERSGDKKKNKPSDPRHAIWKNVEGRSKVTIEKLKLGFSTGSPSPDSAVLKIAMKSRPTKVGKPGTQEVSLSAELICADPDGDESYYATVWKHEDSVGTIAQNALRSGKVPEKMDRNIADFLAKFRMAYLQAAKVATTAEADEAMEDGTVVMEDDVDGGEAMEAEGESEAEDRPIDADPVEESPAESEEPTERTDAES